MNRIAHHLGRYQAQLIRQDSEHGCAAVALLLRNGPVGPEVLFIQRAKHPNDPWSGNLGFPGGRIDAEDATAYAAAVRETEEEVGIVLHDHQLLGQLDDHHGVRIPVRVSCFVFLVADAVEAVGNYEVSHAFWVPLALLAEPERHQYTVIDWHGKPYEVPSLAIQPDKPVLWGLTYRFMHHFFEVVQQPLPPCQAQGADEAKHERFS